MAKKKKPLLNEEEKKNQGAKTELARRIAAQSSRAENTYKKITDFFGQIIRFFSLFIDKVLFNKKHSKLIALILAVIVYGLVNYQEISTVYTTSLQSARTISNVSVVAQYNTDTFEVTGLPASADVTLTGDAANVTNAAGASDGVVVANLDGLTEGTHNVTLTADGYGTNVTAVVNPSTAVVTMKKKTTKEFDISYDFINTDKIDSIYSAGTPELSTGKVNVRASADTLNSIAFIKALIDVSGQTADFETDAPLVAYDSSGNPVNCDIVPSTVHAKVPVSSPSKDVPVRVEISGDMPEGKAVSSVSIDPSVVTIYGSQDALEAADSVTVELDGSSLTKDEASLTRSITLPAGISTASVSQVNVNVTLGESQQKKIANVPIRFINNTNGYQVSQADNITSVTVTACGTSENLADITADDINVYIDLSNAEVGQQEFTLQIDQPADGLVHYSLDDDKYELTIIGSNDTDDENKGANVNNG